MRQWAGIPILTIVRYGLRPFRGVYITKGTRLDRLNLSVMPAQPDIAAILAKPNEENRDSVQRPIFDFDSIINGLRIGCSAGQIDIFVRFI